MAAFDRARFALPAVVAGLAKLPNLVALLCTLAVLAASMGVAALALNAPQGALLTPAVVAPSESRTDTSLID